MITLAELLADETSTGVIFGNIHLRQTELACLLTTDQGDRDFSRASGRDLLDIHFCKAFFEDISESYKGRTMDEYGVQDKTEKAFREATRALGVESYLNQNRATASFAADVVMYGSFGKNYEAHSVKNRFRNSDAYNAIYPTALKYNLPREALEKDLAA